MKYHSILTSALTSLCLLTSSSTLAAENARFSSAKQSRWFEIEVILFKHITKKSSNAEQFTVKDLRTKKRRALDLLTPYLQPNIASLKQLLPSCEKKAENLPYNITITSYTPWSKSVNTDVDAFQSVDESENNTTTELPIYNQYPMNSKTPLCIIPTDFIQQHLNAEQREKFSVDSIPIEKFATTINGVEQWRADENGQITWASDKPYLISKKSLRLKSIAKRIKRSPNYKPLLHLGWRQKGKTKRQAQAVKLYTGENLNLQYKKELSRNFDNLTAIEVTTILEERLKSQQQLRKALNSTNQKFPVLLNNTETNNTETNIGATTSSPARVGEGVKFPIINELSVNEVPVNVPSIAETLRQKAQQQQLNTLFQQYSLLPSQESTEELANNDTNVLNISNEGIDTKDIIFDEQEVKRIIAQLSTDIISPTAPAVNGNNTLGTHPIIPPAQPWSIDGLFKVHLDHYLYIDSEINIIEPSSGSLTLTTSQKSKNKRHNEPTPPNIISFKQNRRVITGEIHYFDHPHIGMVVQIRRFDPTKPANQAVSQSKK
jgi:hypothetical protein